MTAFASGLRQNNSGPAPRELSAWRAATARDRPPRGNRGM